MRQAMLKTVLLRGALVLALCAAALPAGAQAGTTGSTGKGQAAAPASAGPGEPEIVMPQVVLQIEDLSVEKVVAQLPPEEELLPPERPIPVLSEGDLVIGDPRIPAADLTAEPGAAPAPGRGLSSDITLGAGMQNRIIGTITLSTLGADPRFALKFNHETVDGLAGKPPGSGFSLRNDLLDGTLKFGLGPLDTSLGGTFNESETGLQGLSPFVARLSRSLKGSADFSAAPLDWLSLGAGVDGNADTLTLEGGSPLQRSDLLVSPRISAQARAGIMTFGLQSSYAYRTDTGITGADLQRFTVTGSFSATLPAAFVVSGNVGWFWNSDQLSLVPFSVNVTGTPWQFITFSLAFGYAVQTYNLGDILQAGAYSLPGSLQDDHGWFGSGSVHLTITRDVAATVSASYRNSTALPTGSQTPDPATGLFLVSQGSAQDLAMDAGLRWGISSAFSVSAGWHHEFMDRPFFTPTDSLSGEIVGLDPAGRFGGNLTVLFAPTFQGVLQQPVLRLSGFWKVSDAVKLQLDADDLLWPLLSTPRADIGPYAAPGFRITGSLEMSL